MILILFCLESLKLRELKPVHSGKPIHSCHPCQLAALGKYTVKFLWHYLPCMDRAPSLHGHLPWGTKSWGTKIFCQIVLMWRYATPLVPNHWWFHTPGTKILGVPNHRDTGPEVKLFSMMVSINLCKEKNKNTCD